MSIILVDLMVPRQSPMRKPFYGYGWADLLRAQAISKVLSLEGKSVLLDYGIGKHFAGNAFDFRLRFLPPDVVVEHELEVLTLAQVINALVAHLLERAVYGFALRVEHTFFQRDVNVGFHGRRSIILGRDEP